VLAGKIRFLNKEKEKAKQQALDIQKKANAELENQVSVRTKDLTIAKEQLEKTQQTLTDSFNRVNHEIRTPTTAILQYVGFLQRGIECENPSTSQKKFLKIIDENGIRIKTLTGQLLDLAKLEANAEVICLKAIDLTTLIKKSIENLSSLFCNDVSLSFNTTEPIFAIADENMLQGVIQNLLSNAAKYTPSGSVEIEISKTSDQVKISIKDTGIGISQTDIKSIFLPFFRTQETQAIPGTGLGLSLCKTRIERMGGKIGLTSDKIFGSTFWITLNLTEHPV